MNVSRFIGTPNKTMFVKYRATSRHVCSSWPAGHSAWSLKLLRNKAVELKIIESVAVETVRSALKKINFSLTKMNTVASPQNKM